MALSENQQKDLEKLSQTSDSRPDPMTAIFDQHPDFINNTKLGAEGIAAFSILKSPALGNFVGGSILGLEGATAVSDRLGYTTDLSNKISENEPTIGGIYSKDAIKYASILGSGVKKFKDSGKAFETLKASDAYIADLAQQERMNRMMSMYGRTPYSDVPLSKWDLLKNEGIEIGKQNKETLKGFAEGTGETIDTTANLALKASGDIPQTGEGVAKFLSETVEGTKAVSEASPILSALTERVPQISAAWDTANAGVYALQGDYGNAALKGLEAADQALWLLGPEAGLATIPLNWYLDTLIAERHKNFLGKQKGEGRDKKGITINADGSLDIPKNADKLTQEQAIKYATTGRQIHQDEKGNWYLVDKDNEPPSPKIDLSANASISPETAPPEVTLDLSNYASPKETSPEGLFAAPTPTATPAPSSTPKPNIFPTPVPTATPKPTPTPVSTPVPTPVPTATPKPTSTSTPVPTAVSIPSAAQTPTSSASPIPTPSVLKQPSTIQSTVEVPPTVLGQQQNNNTENLLQGIIDAIKSDGASKGNVNIVGGGSSSNQTTIISTGYTPLKEYKKDIRVLY